MKQHLSALVLLACLSTMSLAQDSTKNTLSLGAYIDTYYAYYSGANDVALQQHNSVGAYHNNIGLNVAQLTASVATNRLRAVSTVHFGDIPSIAWANKYRNIQEANTGVRLADGLWFDLGYFKTHVGTESFLPKDNYFSIITLGTYYGPFYQGGARLSYDRGMYHMEFHFFNGYNQHVDNNREKSVGILISRPFGEQWSASYSNLYGSENTGLLDNDNLLYQSAFVDFDGEKLKAQVGLDVAVATNGSQGLSAGGQALITGLLSVKYQISPHWAFGGRAEYFSDPSGLNSVAMMPYFDDLSGTSYNFTRMQTGPSYLGLNIVGLTGSLEFAPADIGFVRMECRYLNDLNGTDSSPWSDGEAGYSAAQAGVNPHLKHRTVGLITAGIYFDKAFNW